MVMGGIGIRGGTENRVFGWFGRHGVVIVVLVIL